MHFIINIIIVVIVIVVIIVIIIIVIIVIVIVVIVVIINTVAVMFDNCDWRMMLKLLGVSSYRRRIKADRRMKGGAKTVHVIWLKTRVSTVNWGRLI